MTKDKEMNPDNRIIATRSFLGGFLLFIVAFPLKIILLDIFTSLLEGTWRLPFRELSATTLLAAYWITIFLWLFLLPRKKTWAEHARIFRTKYHIDRRTAILFMVLIGGFLAARFVRPHEGALCSTIRQYQAFWGQVWGSMLTASQYIYYLIEGVMMAFITDAFQTAGEKLFKKKWIPWGGLGLALTWGVLHIYTKGPSMGIRVIFFGLFFGILYMIGKRNALPPILAWMLNYFY